MNYCPHCGVGLKTNILHSAKYARLEPTRDRNAPEEGLMDVVVYSDKDATKFYARFPWHYRTQPTKGDKKLLINSFEWDLIWLDDLKE